MISLGWPWVFALLPLPWLVWRLLPAAAPSDPPLYSPLLARRYLDQAPVAAARPAPRRLRVLLLTLVWLLLLAAASRPTWIGEAVSLPTSGRDLMLAVDISESMLQEDMQVRGQRVDRLTAVKAVLGEFVQRRDGDRIGLILFGTQAYLQSPLSFDRDTVYRLLVEAQTGFAGRRTAIGDAIGIAIKRLRERPAAARVLILLTDGANTAGEVEPFQAAQLAAAEGVRVHTIGVGADELVLGGLFGRRRVNPSADLDEQLLQAIADATGGRYFRARDPEELERVYRELDRLEPIEQAPETLRPQRSLLHWPLGLAMLIGGGMALNLLAPWRRLRGAAP